MTEIFGRLKKRIQFKQREDLFTFPEYTPLVEGPRASAKALTTALLAPILVPPSESYDSSQIGDDSNWITSHFNNLFKIYPEIMYGPWDEALTVVSGRKTITSDDRRSFIPYFLRYREDYYAWVLRPADNIRLALMITRDLDIGFHRQIDDPLPAEGDDLAYISIKLLRKMTDMTYRAVDFKDEKHFFNPRIAALIAGKYKPFARDLPYMLHLFMDTLEKDYHYRQVHPAESATRLPLCILGGSQTFFPTSIDWWENPDFIELARGVADGFKETAPFKLGAIRPCQILDLPAK